MGSMTRAIAAFGWILFIAIVLGLCCMMMEEADARVHILSGMEGGEYVVAVGENDSGGTAIIEWVQEPPGMVFVGTFPFAGSAQVGVALASAGHSQWVPLSQVADPSTIVWFEPGEPIFTEFLGEGWYTIWVFGAEHGSRLYSRWRTE
jgi:hypothetical protein